MAYPQQRPAPVCHMPIPNGQNDSELGGKITPEIWDNILSQIQLLVENNEKLRETLKANNNEISSLLASKEELQHAKESLENENSDMDKYFQEMSKEVSLLTKDIGNKREEIRYQQTLIDQLAKERDDAYDTARNDLDPEKKLATTVDVLKNNHERQVDSFKQTITDQQEKIAVLEDKLIKVQSDVVDEIEKKQAINNLTKEMESLKEQLTSAGLASNDEVTALKEERNKLSQEKDEAVAEKDRLLQDKDRLLQEKDRFLNEKDKLVQERDKTSKENEQLKNQLSIAKDDITHLESERGNLLTQLQNEKERVHELNVQLDQTKKQLQQAKAEAVKEMKRQKAHILQLLKEKDEAVSKAAIYAEERDSAAAEYQKKENQIKAECQKKIEDYVNEAEHWKLQFEVAREDFNSERAAREKEAKAVDALIINRESLQKQIDDLKKKVTNQQRTIANLEDRLSKHEPVDRTPLVPMDHGPPMDCGPGPMDRGPRPIDRGPRPMDRGPRPMDRRPALIDRGPKPMDRGPRPVDRGPPMDRGMGRRFGPMDRRPVDRGPLPCVDFTPLPKPPKRVAEKSPKHEE